MLDLIRVGYLKSVLFSTTNYARIQFNLLLLPFKNISYMQLLQRFPHSACHWPHWCQSSISSFPIFHSIFLFLAWSFRVLTEFHHRVYKSLHSRIQYPHLWSTENTILHCVLKNCLLGLLSQFWQPENGICLFSLLTMSFSSEPSFYTLYFQRVYTEIHIWCPLTTYKDLPVLLKLLSVTLPIIFWPFTVLVMSSSSSA